MLRKYWQVQQAHHQPQTFWDISPHPNVDRDNMWHAEAYVCALHVCLALDFIGRILDATMFGRSTVRNLFPQGPGVHTETVI